VSDEQKLREGWIKIEVVDSVAGAYLTIDDTRVAGPKPLGGGTMLYTIIVHKDSFKDAIYRILDDDHHTLKAENKRLRKALEELVTLKDIKDKHHQEDPTTLEDYNRRKTPAWEAARMALEDSK
jgi:hypothetical protein